eukprot:PhM_4_TR6289/c0_g1_i1/m.35591
MRRFCYVNHTTAAMSLRNNKFTYLKRGTTAHSPHHPSTPASTRLRSSEHYVSSISLWSSQQRGYCHTHNGAEHANGEGESVVKVVSDDIEGNADLTNGPHEEVVIENRLASDLGREDVADTVQNVFSGATLDEFRDDVLCSTDKVFVMFCAEWCAQCLATAPKVRRLSEELSSEKSFSFWYVDVDETPDVADVYSVTQIPCWVLFRKKKEVARFLDAEEMIFETRKFARLL